MAERLPDNREAYGFPGLALQSQPFLLARPVYPYPPPYAPPLR
ncbi:hypothetical protein ABIF74_009006 [Bradyrhizobium japonicum]